ncbi:MAG: hypothetical protein AAGB12_08455 [Pseudomonadota bacterium]
MGKFISRFILFLVFLIIIIQAIVHFKISRDLATPLRLAEMGTQAKISHGLIYVNYNGEISITQVAVDAAHLGMNLTLDAIKFKGPSLLELANFNFAGWQTGNIPEQMWFALKGGKIVLDPRIIDAASIQSNDMDLWGSLEVLACGSIKRFELSDYLAMGYSRIHFFGDIRFDIDKITNEVLIASNATALNMSQVDWELKLGQVQFDNILQPPIIKSFSFHSQDYSLVGSKNRYCAELSTSSEAQYIEEHIKQLDLTLMSLDFPLSQAIIDAYRDYLNEPESIRLVFAPTLPMPIQEIASYPLAKIPEILGARIAINEQEIKPLIDTERQLPPEKIAQLQSTFRDVDDDDSDDNDESQVIRLQGYTFKSTTVEQMSNYLEHEAKIWTKNRKFYQGVIRSMNKNYLEFAAKTDNGTLTLPIRLQEIEKVEVFR